MLRLQQAQEPRLCLGHESQAPRSRAERDRARSPSAANKWGSMAAATLRVISSCGKDVTELTVVAFSPVMTAAHCVDELCTDTQLLSCRRTLPSST